MAGICDFKIEQNSDFKTKIYRQDSKKVPISFTGITPKMQIRKITTDGELIKDVSNNITVFNDYLYINIPASENFIFNRDISKYQLLYDLIIEKDGEVKRLLEGKILISTGVTPI